MVAPAVASAASVRSRHLRSQEAVERQRAVRQRKKKLRRQQRRKEESERPGWELDACARLARRCVRHGTPVHPLHHVYAYWQVRRLGYDVLRPEWRTRTLRQDGTRDLDPPESTPIWVWWISVHWKERDKLVGEKRARVSVQGVSLQITNPMLYVDTGE